MSQFTWGLWCVLRTCNQSKDHITTEDKCRVAPTTSTSIPRNQRTCFLACMTSRGFAQPCPAADGGYLTLHDCKTNTYVNNTWPLKTSLMFTYTYTQTVENKSRASVQNSVWPHSLHAVTRTAVLCQGPSHSPVANIARKQKVASSAVGSGGSLSFVTLAPSITLEGPDPCRPRISNTLGLNVLRALEQTSGSSGRDPDDDKQTEIPWLTMMNLTWRG